MTQSLVESANAILRGEKVQTFHEMALDEQVEFFIEELNEEQYIELQVLEELGEQWELTEEDYVEAIRCIYEAEREGGLTGFVQKHFSKSGRLQKKIDKQKKSKERSDASVAKKADIANKEKELATATAAAKAARKADTGTEKTKGQIVKQKARIAGKKVVKGIKQGVKNFVFGKKKKPAAKTEPQKSEPQKTNTGGSSSKGLSDTQKQKNTMLKHKLQKRKKEREGGVAIRHQKMEQFKKQWQQTGIQDSHDLGVYYDVLAGNTEK